MVVAPMIFVTSVQLMFQQALQTTDNAAHAALVVRVAMMQAILTVAGIKIY